jgi:hypothetical protein
MNRPAVIYDYRDEALHAQPIGGELARYIREQNDKVIAAQERRKRQRLALQLLTLVMLGFVASLIGAWLAS